VIWIIRLRRFLRNGSKARELLIVQTVKRRNRAVGVVEGINFMGKNFKYLKYIISHKYYVFRAGLKVGCPIWQLIIHDWHKFLPSEWFPYVEYFYGEFKPENPMYGVSIYQQECHYKLKTEYNFDLAWNSHQKRAKHHWQYWILLEDSGPFVESIGTFSTHGSAYEWGPSPDAANADVSTWS